jgi:ribosomal protein S18 acetylase RimI-like enzyme
MKQDALRFKPIHLNSDAEVCVRFRRDSFTCSFGRDGFFDEAGPNGVEYLERLRQRQARFPDGYVHVWHGDKIIGQMEMQIIEEPPIGYVNLFYLIPEMRGVGLAPALQAYAMAFCARHRVRLARLSVSPTNQRAIAFYRKHGWNDIGPRPGHEEVNLMECIVPENLDEFRERIEQGE